jgi:hypothetical protein
LHLCTGKTDAGSQIEFKLGTYVQIKNAVCTLWSGWVEFETCKFTTSTTYQLEIDLRTGLCGF